MEPIYIAKNGESYGPYTRDQIYNMWQSGTLAADTLFFESESQLWKPLIEVVEHFKPATGLKKLLNIKRPSLEEQRESELAGNKGCGCLSIGAALFLLYGGIASLFFSPYTTTDTKTEREYVANPSPVYRDIYKTHSPEEERAYQQKVSDSHWKPKTKRTARGMTSDEKVTQTIFGLASLFIGITFIFVARHYYQKAKMNTGLTTRDVRLKKSRSHGAGDSDGL